MVMNEIKKLADKSWNDWKVFGCGGKEWAVKPCEGRVVVRVRFVFLLAPCY
jgi:hypothetical protein